LVFKEPRFYFAERPIKPYTLGTGQIPADRTLSAPRTTTVNMTTGPVAAAVAREANDVDGD